jgi:hypothetical protein
VAVSWTTGPGCHEDDGRWIRGWLAGGGLGVIVGRSFFSQSRVEIGGYHEYLGDVEY